jgi:DNA ligase (NAD+)
VEWFGKYSEWVRTCGVPLKERVRGNLTGKSFCFTGKTKTKRGTLEDMVRGAGGTVKGSAGKGLTYLVMADPSSGSTKAQAAKKNGTETISEEDFLKMVGA